MSRSSEESSGKAKLAELSGQLEHRLWLGGFLLASVLTPLSLLRAFTTGWLTLYSLHVGIYALALAIHLLRRRIQRRVLAVCALVYLEIAGGLGLFMMGFLGFGCLWLAGTSYLGAVVFGLRAGIGIAAANLLMMMVAMTGFQAGLLTVPVQVNDYMQSPGVWVLALTMMAAFPWMLMNSVVHYRDAIVDLLKQTETQRAEIERLASRDELTGLVHVRVAHDRLQMALRHAQRSGRKVAVLFLDLDGFKAVNDHHGHAAGDHVLCTVGSLLTATLRDSDTASRIGGDEFLLILDDLVEDEVAMRIARRLLAELRRPIPHQGKLLRVGASIGLAIYPDDGAEMKDLLAAADEAMYEVKRQGKEGFLKARTGRLQRASDLASRTGEVRQLHTL